MGNILSIMQAFEQLPSDEKATNLFFRAHKLFLK